MNTGTMVITEKHKRGLDAFDLEAMSAGQAISALSFYSLRKKGKKQIQNKIKKM